VRSSGSEPELCEKVVVDESTDVGGASAEDGGGRVCCRSESAEVADIGMIGCGDWLCDSGSPKDVAIITSSASFASKISICGGVETIGGDSNFGTGARLFKKSSTVSEAIGVMTRSSVSIFEGSGLTAEGNDSIDGFNFRDA